MWHPEPGWQPLTSGSGTSTVGVWLAGDRVVKRLGAPLPGDPAELSDPRHVAWWRRPADVAVSGLVDATPGLRSPVALRIEVSEASAAIRTRSPAGRRSESASNAMMPRVEPATM